MEIECPNCHAQIDPLESNGCPFCGLTLPDLAEYLGLGSVDDLVSELTNGYPEDYYQEP